MFCAHPAIIAKKPQKCFSWLAIMIKHSAQGLRASLTFIGFFMTQILQDLIFARFAWPWTTCWDDGEHGTGTVQRAFLKYGFFHISLSLLCFWNKFSLSCRWLNWKGENPTGSFGTRMYHSWWGGNLLRRSLPAIWLRIKTWAQGYGTNGARGQYLVAGLSPF